MDEFESVLAVNSLIRGEKNKIFETLEKQFITGQFFV